MTSVRQKKRTILALCIARLIPLSGWFGRAVIGREPQDRAVGPGQHDAIGVHGSRVDAVGHVAQSFDRSARGHDTLEFSASDENDRFSIGCPSGITGVFSALEPTGLR